MARRKPGYMLEVLEGPRKGKIVFSSQVVFRPTVFPMNKDKEPVTQSDNSEPADDDWIACDLELPIDEWYTVEEVRQRVQEHGRHEPLRDAGPPDEAAHPDVAPAPPAPECEQGLKENLSWF